MTGKFQRRYHFDSFHLFVVLCVVVIVLLCVIGILSEQVRAQ